MSHATDIEAMSQRFARNLYDLAAEAIWAGRYVDAVEYLAMADHEHPGAYLPIIAHLTDNAIEATRKALINDSLGAAGEKVIVAMMFACISQDEGLRTRVDLLFTVVASRQQEGEELEEAVA